LTLSWGWYFKVNSSVSWLCHNEVDILR
jgi:hypothetical protein